MANGTIFQILLEIDIVPLSNNKRRRGKKAGKSPKALRKAKAAYNARKKRREEKANR